MCCRCLTAGPISGKDHLLRTRNDGVGKVGRVIQFEGHLGMQEDGSRADTTPRSSSADRVPTLPLETRSSCSSYHYTPQSGALSKASRRTGFKKRGDGSPFASALTSNKIVKISVSLLPSPGMFPWPLQSFKSVMFQ